MSCIASPGKAQTDRCQDTTNNTTSGSSLMQNSQGTRRQTCAALAPGCTIVRLNEHDQEDGVPASPAQEGTPDHKGVEPAAVIA